MAVLTAKGISAVNVELLSRSIVLPNTVTMIPGSEFTGDNGDTITVRVPQPSASRKQSTRGATITYDDVTEIPVDVKIWQLYHAKKVSNEEMNLDIKNFAKQVSRVQVDAVAVGAENELAAVMNALSADGSFDGTPEGTDNAIKEAREFLTRSSAPLGDRFLACSPEVISLLLSVDKFVRADALGDGRSSALRDAIAGRIYGFTVVETAGLDAGEAVAYHRSGFVFANKTPIAPRGAADAAAASNQDIGLMQVFDYENSILSDTSTVTTFAGAAAVYENGTGTNGSTRKRFFKLETDASSSSSS